MMLDTQVATIVRACTFISRPCGSSGALCLVMSHRASLLRPSLVHGWITAILCIVVSQTLISKVYRECRMLLHHELFAKLHRVNITQSTYWRVSIGYLCTEELAVLCHKVLNCNNLRIVLDYSRHTDSRVFWSHLRQTYCQSALANFAARRFSCCAPPFAIVFLHLYALLTVSLFFGLSWRLMFVRHL